MMVMHIAGHLVVEVLHGNKEAMCLEEMERLKFTGWVNKIHGTQISMRTGRLKGADPCRHSTGEAR
jgi:hypothetical protein